MRPQSARRFHCHLRCNVSVVAQIQHVTRKRRLPVETALANSVIVATIHLKTYDDNNGGGERKRQPTKPRRNGQVPRADSSLSKLNFKSIEQLTSSSSKKKNFRADNEGCEVERVL
jgi:hypothetical protein